MCTTIYFILISLYTYVHSMIAYMIWNCMFVYSNYSFSFGWHVAVLAAPLPLSNLTQQMGYMASRMRLYCTEYDFNPWHPCAPWSNNGGGQDVTSCFICKHHDSPCNQQHESAGRSWSPECKIACADPLMRPNCIVGLQQMAGHAMNDKTSPIL